MNDPLVGMALIPNKASTTKGLHSLGFRVTTCPNLNYQKRIIIFNMSSFSRISYEIGIFPIIWFMTCLCRLFSIGSVMEFNGMWKLVGFLKIKSRLIIKKIYSLWTSCWYVRMIFQNWSNKNQNHKIEWLSNWRSYKSYKGHAYFIICSM